MGKHTQVYLYNAILQEFFRTGMIHNTAESQKHILNERNLTKETTDYMIPFTQNSMEGKIIVTESRLLVNKNGKRLEWA